MTEREAQVKRAAEEMRHALCLAKGWPGLNRVAAILAEELAKAEERGRCADGGGEAERRYPGAPDAP